MGLKYDVHQWGFKFKWSLSSHDSIIQLGLFSEN